MLPQIISRSWCWGNKISVHRHIFRSLLDKDHKIKTTSLWRMRALWYSADPPSPSWSTKLEAIQPFDPKLWAIQPPYPKLTKLLQSLEKGDQWRSGIHNGQVRTGFHKYKNSQRFGQSWLSPIHNPQRPGQSWLSQIYKLTESQRPLGQHRLSQRKRMRGQSLPGQQGAALVLFKQLFTALQPSLPRSSYKQYYSASHLNSTSQLLPTKLTFPHKRGPQKRSQNV